MWSNQRKVVVQAGHWIATSYLRVATSQTLRMKLRQNPKCHVDLQLDKALQKHRTWKSQNQRMNMNVFQEILQSNQRYS